MKVKQVWREGVKYLDLSDAAPINCRALLEELREEWSDPQIEHTSDDGRELRVRCGPVRDRRYTTEGKQYDEQKVYVDNGPADVTPEGRYRP